MHIPVAACVLVATFVVQGGLAAVTSGSSCGAVLDAGVYNIISSSSSSENYRQIQTALCTSYSDYTYDMYTQSRAAFDASGGINAGSGASSYCSSDAFRFDVAAKASYFGVIGGSVSGSYATSSAECESNSQSTYKSYQLLSQSTFSAAMTSIRAYQASSCGSSGDLSSGSATVQYLSKIIEPTVYSAYIACLKLYAVGIQYTVTPGFDSTSLAVDLLYVPALNNVPAQLYGLATTSTTVTCKLSGPGITAAQSTSFIAKLTPNTAYTIFCQLLPGTPVDGQFSDIYISISPGGTYHGILYHSVPKNQLNSLKSKLNGQSGLISALQGQIVSLQGQTLSLGTQIAELQSKANVTTSSADPVLVRAVNKQQLAVKALQTSLASVQDAANTQASNLTALEMRFDAQQTALASVNGQVGALQDRSTGLERKVRNVVTGNVYVGDIGGRRPPTDLQVSGDVTSARTTYSGSADTNVLVNHPPAPLNATVLVTVGNAAGYPVIWATSRQYGVVVYHRTDETQTSLYCLETAGETQATRLYLALVW